MADTKEQLAAEAGVADPTVTPPLAVPDSAALKIVYAVVRYLLVALGAWLAAKQPTHSDLINQGVGYALIVLPTALGGWLTRHANDKLKLLEQFVPNSIAYRT